MMLDCLDRLLGSKAGRTLIGLVGLTSFFLAFLGMAEGWTAMWIPGFLAFFSLCFALGVLL